MEHYVPTEGKGTKMDIDTKLRQNAEEAGKDKSILKGILNEKVEAFDGLKANSNDQVYKELET
jgi:hypothetical protein